MKFSLKEVSNIGIAINKLLDAFAMFWSISHFSLIV